MSKIIKLKKILKGLGRVVVAYSGGRDSVFLLKIAVDTLGRANVIAVTARSETYPYSEYKEAIRLAKSIGARHITIRTNELDLKKFKSNPVNRCYYCKKELFGKLKKISEKYETRHILDGTNMDDLKDIRHGSKAAKELGVIRPLLEAGITKSDISGFSKRLKLPTWDKPSGACLASRFPFNDPITKDGLVRIGKAENFLHKLGFTQIRVRIHDSIARIEIQEQELGLGLKFKSLIIKKLKKLGFIYVTLDLEGYRTGSMHEGMGLLRHSTAKSGMAT
jgi:uncharacterized protein